MTTISAKLRAAILGGAVGLLPSIAFADSGSSGTESTVPDHAAAEARSVGDTSTSSPQSPAGIPDHAAAEARSTGDTVNSAAKRPKGCKTTACRTTPPPRGEARQRVTERQPDAEIQPPVARVIYAGEVSASPPACTLCPEPRAAHLPLLAGGRRRAACAARSAASSVAPTPASKVIRAARSSTSAPNATTPSGRSATIANVPETEGARQRPEREAAGAMSKW